MANLTATSLDIAAIRADFPILERRVNGRRLVYLDNTATSQKPRVVLEAEDRYYREMNANVHRGIHTLSAEATAAYEASRERVARFLGVADARGVVFTSGTTGGLNLLAHSWGKDLVPGDEILVTEMEHHSNLVPWFLMAKDRGAIVKFIPITDEGRLDLSTLPSLLGPRTRIVSFTHLSNALGTINPVVQIAAAAKKVGARVALDAAQSAPHLLTKASELGVDAIAFSAHKMLGPTGVGALWVRPELLETMAPYQGGGEMIREVYLDHATFAEIPARFEAGTPNIAGVIAFHAAIEYLEGVGSEALHRHETALMAYALERMQSLGGFRILGPLDAAERIGALTFADEQIHPHDLSTFLDQAGVAIRAGHHCAQPLHRRYGLVATARASFYLYNDREDIDALIEGLSDARAYFA